MDSGDSQYAPEANGRLFLTALVSSLTGNVSIGFMHATPGDMKSLRSSADRIALMVASDGGGWWRGFCVRPAQLLVYSEPKANQTEQQQLQPEETDEEIARTEVSHAESRLDM